MRKYIIYLLSFFLVLPNMVFAQTASQQAGGLDTLRQMEERSRELRKRIEDLQRQEKELEEERAAAPSKETIIENVNGADVEKASSKQVEEKIEEEVGASVQEQVSKDNEPKAIIKEEGKLFVKMIMVRGADTVPQEVIWKITQTYENRTLSIVEIKKLVDQITDAYRTRGYVTSKAYLPPQDMTLDTLLIKVVEGKVGEIKIEDNKYSSERLLRSYIKSREGEALNFDQLRADMQRINQRPDRQVRSVLTPGKATGSSDVILKVKERIPLHLTVTTDNYASKYVNRVRYQGVLTDNNFLGFDDTLALQYQVTNQEAYKLGGVRYTLPVTESTQVGLYASKSYSELTRELKDVQARGKSTVYSASVTQDLHRSDLTNVSGNLGFTYKDVYNFQNGAEINEDRMRIAQTGVTLEHTDKLGRTIVSDGVDVGIPGILSGTKKHPDNFVSRVGSGGQFVKNTIDVIRLQATPVETSLLVKGQYQMSSRILTATEQYQIGGISNNRGYPSGEASGDSGGYVSAELSAPMYFLPKGMMMPLSHDRLYDALRMEAFYDLGYVALRNPSANEHQQKTLRSVGTGLRLNMSDSSYARIDYAWPLSGKSSEGNSDGRLWFQVSKDF